MTDTTRPRNTRSRNAFSLLEVVIAMGILSFGLLTLALMQVHALTQGSAGRHTGDAAAVARSYLEQVHRIPWTDLDAAVGNGWRDPDWLDASATWDAKIRNPDGNLDIEHSYTVQWRVSAVAGSTCLRDVELLVNWAETNVPGIKLVIMATRRYNWGGSGC